MSLRIACDLDGTLADMNSALEREAERIFGEAVDVGTYTTGIVTDPTRPETAACDESVGDARARSLAGDERSRLWNHLREIDNFWETLPEIESGAVARLGEMAAAQGWEILFLTRRPDTAGATVQVQSQRW